MKKLHIIWFLCITAVLSVQKKVDLLITNTKIYTVNQNFDVADAMAVYKGKVVAVGSGHIVDGKKQDLEVKEGDQVVFSKFAGTELNYEGKDYLILRENDILAVIG